LTLVLFFSSILYGNIVAAESPSFVRQEITDPPKDWILWKEPSDTHSVTTHEGHKIKVNNANDISECEKHNVNDEGIAFDASYEDKEFFSPDIQSVSYISDGKHLNGTIWLTSDFIEPSTKDSIDTFQEELVINISNIEDSVGTFSKELEKNISKESLTLENYTKYTKALLLARYEGITIKEQDSTFVAGNPGYRVVYILNEKPNETKKVMHIWTISSNKSYEIIYTALEDEYSPYLNSSINQMIESLRIADFNQGTKDRFYKESYENTVHGGFSAYVNSTIKMLYPKGWETYQNWEGATGFIKFISPFKDEIDNEPSWQETRYLMALDIDSVHDTGTDYRIALFRAVNDDGSLTWTREVREISANSQIKVIEQTNNYTDFYNKNGGPYVAFSFNLDNVNSPERYKAVFYVSNLFVKNHQFCNLLDTTNWINIPPPKFDFSTEPSNVISLRPGEETNIQLRVKSNTDLESKAVFVPPTASDKGISMDVIPNEISVPSSDTGTSTTINIKALPNATVGRTDIVPIITNISFPSVIVNRGGDIFNNSKTVTINETPVLNIRILPPYSVENHLAYITNTWITPLSGIWTLLAAVGAVIIPLIVKIYYKKRKSNPVKEQPD
jgi:hypothetical protein